MIVHECPPDGSGVTPCCGKTPFELPPQDRIALEKKLVTCRVKYDHQWPKAGDHLWSVWKAETGLPKPTESRTCLHPECNATETRTATIAPMQ